MTATLRDVARRAGVSIPTASRVLSGSEYPVREKRRKLVEDAAKELDYVPNAHARGLLGGGLGTVGVLAGDVGDPYFSEIIDGIQAVAVDQQLLVTICNTRRDVTLELGYFTLLQSNRTEVVIVAGSELNDPKYISELQSRVESFQSSGGRVVAIGHPHLNTDRVVVDNRAGGRELARHLVELGHREIGVLAGFASIASIQDRIKGVTEVVEQARGSIYLQNVAATRDGGYKGTRSLMSKQPKITAIIGSADQMAIGSLAYFRESSIAVPNQISVAGFNDIAVSRDMTPRLTTVSLPLAEIGRTALNLALEKKSDGEIQIRNFSTTLIVRESTGPI